MSKPVAWENTPAVAADSSAARPRNVAEAAQQFEALLIAQMLKGARGDDQAGWFGSGEDAGSATAAELAEEQFAQALARSGGLGLGRQIASSLSRQGQPPTDSEAPALRGIFRGGRR